MTKAPRVMLAALCPVLLATFPLLSLFAQNQTELELSVLAWPLVICVVAAVLLFGLFLLLTRRAAHACLLSSLSVVAFFYYGVFFEQGSTWSILLWLGVFVLAAVAVLRTKRDLRILTLSVIVAAAVLAVPQMAKVVSYHVNHPGLSATDPRLWPTALPAPAVRAGAKRPDIYVIIPDDYARSDVLRHYFKYDNNAFLRQLTDRGFVIADQSRSPYADSESNIASALNMDYLTNFPHVLGTDSTDVRPIKRVMENNRSARLITAAGYQYVHFDTDDVTFAGRNPSISSLGPPDGFANLWMRKSLLHQVGGPVGFNQAATNARYRHSIHKVFAQLTARRPAGPPQFVVFHTLLPHDPYVFTSDGRAETFAAASDLSLSSPDGRRAYLQQLEYLHDLLLHAVDEIRAHATTPPVILIQADEGFQAAPEDFGEDAMTDIRAKGLTALSLPGMRDAGPPNPPNTVNSLRFIFNRYLGTNYDLLPSASYPEGDLPYDFTPMTVK
jgi:hypothetical protein